MFSIDLNREVKTGEVSDFIERRRKQYEEAYEESAPYFGEGCLLVIKDGTSVVGTAEFDNNTISVKHFDRMYGQKAIMASAIRYFERNRKHWGVYTTQV